MVKTLATLAVSMTGGALLLAWMEPQPSEVAGNRDLYGWGVHQLAARRAVGAAVDVKPAGWSAVEVLALPEAGPGRHVALAATVPPDNLHFLVSPQGDVQPLAPWRRQQAAGETGRVIRIGVIGAAHAAALPVVQCDALRALLLELSDLAGRMPVRVAGPQQDLLAAGPASSQSLHALLVERGFVD
jgi:hypothetical protein